MQKTLLLLFLVSISLISCQTKKDQSFPGYKVKEFDFQGHTARVVFPKKKNMQGHWIWRARFWGAEPQVEKALLEKGFHVVYVDVANLYGNQKAINLWNDFYDFCVKKYGLNSKVVLEGLSRGGLIIYNWAAQNADKVACIYADAPVCDIKSWPGGLYKGLGSADAWEICLNAHDLDTASVLNYQGIPLHTSTAVAKAKIPTIHVCGDSDEVVPFDENTALVMKIFEANGSKIELILKEGIGHHPHSLKNPKPIVDFIVASVDQ